MKLPVWLLTVTVLAFGAGCPSGAAQSEDALAEGLAGMRIGVGDLRQAAKNGHPLLLQQAESEVVEGLLQALEASVVDGRLDPKRYKQALAGFDEVQGLFKEIPYTLEVVPGQGLRPMTLPLRVHPWWALEKRTPAGWQAERIESGARLSL